VNDMLLRTSTATAPWTIVEGNYKWFARVKTLRTLVEVLSKELDYQPVEPPVAGVQSEDTDEAKRARKGKKKGKKKKKGRGKKEK
jgi:hypothetical protein